MDLHIYYTVNMGIGNYFRTQIPEIEKINGQMKIKTANLYGKVLKEHEMVQKKLRNLEMLTNDHDKVKHEII